MKVIAVAPLDDTYLVRLPDGRGVVVNEDRDVSPPFSVDSIIARGGWRRWDDADRVPDDVLLAVSPRSAVGNGNNQYKRDNPTKADAEKLFARLMPDQRKAVQEAERRKAFRNRVFHGTASQAIESIKKHGLKPSGGWGGDAWMAVQTRDPYGVIAEMKTGERGQSVYVSRSYDIAEQFAYYAAAVNPGSTPVVLRVQLPDDVTLKQDERFPHPDAKRIPHEIPPEWIEGVVDSGHWRKKARALARGGGQFLYVVAFMDDEDELRDAASKPVAQRVADRHLKPMARGVLRAFRKAQRLVSTSAIEKALLEIRGAIGNGNNQYTQDNPTKGEAQSFQRVGGDWNRSPVDGARPYAWQADKPANYTPPPVVHKVVRGEYTAAWGNSHGTSFAITGAAAELMGISGYATRGDKPAAGTWPDEVAQQFLAEIAASPGSEEALYHAFENVRGTDFKVGDTLRLPLTATAGKPSPGYAKRSFATDQRGAPTVFVFEAGTSMAGYSTVSPRSAKNDYDMDSPEAVFKDRGYIWDEALVAGGFEIVDVKNDVYMGSQHNRQKQASDPDMYQLFGSVVTLRQTEVFDPTTKTWRPRG